MHYNPEDSHLFTPCHENLKSDSGSVGDADMQVLKVDCALWPWHVPSSLHALPNVALSTGSSEMMKPCLEV
jgi:hypothetical protein